MWGPLCGANSQIIAASGISYRLRATFDADNQSFSDAQVLDTAAEGVQDGQLTATILDGTIAVSGNKAVYTAQSSPAQSDQKFSYGTISRAIGTALLLDASFDQTTAYGYPGIFGTTDTGDFSTAIGGILTNADATLSAKLFSNNNPVIGTYASGTEYRTCTILGGHDVNGVPYNTGDTKADFKYGHATFIKGGAYTNWTLLFRLPTEGTATLYPMVANYDQSGYWDDIVIPDADLSALLVPTVLDTSVSETDTFTHDADMGMEVKLTTLPSSGNIEVWFRTDWALRVTSAGAVSIVEDADGTPTVRATSGSTATNTSRIFLTAEDDDIVVYVDDGGRAAYASATANKTATAGEVNSLGTGGAISHIATYPRTGYAALDNY